MGPYVQTTQTFFSGGVVGGQFFGGCLGSICGIASTILYIINSVLVPLIFAIAFIVFLYGIAKAYIFFIQRAGGGQEGPYAHSLGTRRVRSHDFHLGSRQYRREYLRPRRLLCAAIADVIVYERYPHSARKLIDTIHRSVTITSLITNKSGRAPMDNCAT